MVITKVTIVYLALRNNNCVQYAKKSSSCPCINDPYKGNDCLFSCTEQQLCENIEYENKKDGRYMAPEECKNNMTKSKVCYYTDDYCNGTECACKCEEQPLCEDIGCEVTAVGECMTTTNHKQNTTKFSGYTCNNEYFKGNDTVSKNNKELLCEDIGCDDQAEGDCVSEQNSKKYTTTLPGYNCTAVFCKSNDCVSKYKEQKLCEDIGCGDQTDGRYTTKGKYDKSMPDSKEYHCYGDSAPIKITDAKIH